MTYSEEQIDQMREAIADLIDDLYENHDYFRDCDCARDCGYGHVVTLLKLLRQDSSYSRWADTYLKEHAEMVEAA
jgi:hypothetical protein